MEKAILKTLIYADIFDYPLKAWEIHKWLIGKHASLKQVEKTINHLIQKSKLKSQNNLYFLPKKDKLVFKRLKRENQSKKYLNKAKIISQLFKLIPWIKLVGVSGSLAMDNVKTLDDIDLFAVTSKNRIFLSRLLLLLILEAIGKRRKRGDSSKKSAGKICINLLLEEDNLALQNRNIYLAHEVLQMKVLWQKNGVYQKYLEDNTWVFKHLPNWISAASIKYQVSSIKGKKHNIYYMILNTFLNLLEHLAKWFQLKIMGKPKGREKILNGALYFHPNDAGEKILEAFTVAKQRDNI